nr:putative ribonuclease H-like domain-containing protein [Tanacetum cinerariifolium]
LAEYINTLSWNHPAFYNYDDDDDEDYTIAITPVLSIEEPDNSLSMGDEHLDIIPATKLDEDFSYSNDDSTLIDDDSFSINDIDYVEASPPHSELISLKEVKDFHPEDGELEDDVLREKLSKINLLIAKIEALNANPTPSSDFVLKSPSSFPNSFLEETDTSDNSLPGSEIFCFDIEEKNSGSTTIHADISLPDLECFYFKSEPDPRDLTSVIDLEIRENVSSTTNVNLPFEDDQSSLFAYVVWIFLPFLTYPVAPPYLLSFGNKDTIFDPDISICHSFMSGVSHRRQIRFVWCGKKRLKGFLLGSCSGRRVNSVMGKLAGKGFGLCYKQGNGVNEKGRRVQRDTYHAYFAAEGINHQTSVARTPEQNVVVKRQNRTLVEAARTMLSAAKVPLFFWAEAIATACFTQNRSLGILFSQELTAYLTRVIVETIHVNFDELPQMASDHVSSDPIPQCQRTAPKHDSLSPGPQCQENVPQADRTVTTSNELDLLFSSMFDELLNESSQAVSKSSVETTPDASNQRQQQNTTPLHNQTTTEPTCQVPTQAPTVSSTENINQAETIEENAQVENDEFINIFCTPVYDR